MLNSAKACARRRAVRASHTQPASISSVAVADSFARAAHQVDIERFALAHRLPAELDGRVAGLAPSGGRCRRFRCRRGRTGSRHRPGCLSCCLPPSSRWIGSPKCLPLRSHRAMSMAAMAVIVTDVRPKYIVRRYIFCHSRSFSSGFSPTSISRSPQAMLWLNGASMIALTTSGDESASPIPSRPVSVRTRTSTASWLLAVLAWTFGMRRIWQTTWVIFMEAKARRYKDRPPTLPPVPAQHKRGPKIGGHGFGLLTRSSQPFQAAGRHFALHRGLLVPMMQHP